MGGQVVRLRRWQAEALSATERSDRDVLVVATPGAGKTTFANAFVLRDLGSYPHRRVIVVAPTVHLKRQWARAAEGFGLQLDPSWTGPWSPDIHGIVVTYAQVASDPDALARVSADAVVILDEVHHAGDDRSWGAALEAAFARAGRRLSLSGTPFRSDSSAIPFVRYDDDGRVVADYVYDYASALQDATVVRPVFFPRVGGHAEWVTPEGAHVSATFDDPLDAQGCSQRLRTVLDADGGWLPDVLRQADEQLMVLRRVQPDAGGLVIASDVEHARAVVSILRRVSASGADPVLVTSGEIRASDRITEFSTSSAPWIVAVKMISEGVDIPRLRVGVYATNVVTQLFFDQAVGRLVRWQAGRARQRAWMWVPDDPRLREYATQLVRRRVYGVNRRAEERRDLDERSAEDRGEQMSLFTPIASSAASGEEMSAGVFDESGDLPGAGSPELYPVELPPPPRRTELTGGGVPVVVRRERLREKNNDRVRMIAQLTGLPHGQINIQLNAAAGVARVAAASLAQLDRRLREADRWLSRC